MEARADIAGLVRSWADRWGGAETAAVVTAEQVGVLVAGLDRAAEPDAPTLAELLTSLTAERAATAIARMEQLRNLDRALTEQESAKADQRKEIPEQHDDDYQLQPGEPPRTLRTLPFGEHGPGLVTFLIYPPDGLVLVVKIQWLGD